MKYHLLKQDLNFLIRHCNLWLHLIKMIMIPILRAIAWQTTRDNRACVWEKNKTNTWVKRVSERPKRGQNSLNQAKIAENRPKGTKGDKRAIFTHVSLFFFSYTHAWVFCVVSHAIALNIGIIIIFIKCNHKWQCLIKKFRSCFSTWLFKYQFCYLLHKFTINI